MSRLQAPRSGCVVRAYRHGLGDCFLIAFGAGNGQERYMLIDCGVLLGTPDAGATMTRVAEDISEATGGHLHVLVATHQHWDHISGFGQAQPVFEDMTIDELWVAWTENPADPDARALLEKYGFAAATIRSALALGADAADEPGLAEAAALTGFLGPLEPGARWSTDRIMKSLLADNRDRTVFCDPGDRLKVSGIPSVSFFVLGPPRDLSFVRRSHPREGEAYLTGEDTARHAALAAALGVGEPDVSPDDGDWSPFNPAFAIPEAAAGDSTPDSAPWLDRLEILKRRYAADPARGIGADWLGPVGDLAIKLDRHLNNTSLALAIELEPGGRVMLFPADAQTGNWLSWHGVAWPDAEGLTARDLLQRTVLYKVGHHASHNATLRDQGLELMTDPALTAIIPLDRETAKKQRWAMPAENLFARLQTQATAGVWITDQDAAEFSALEIEVTELYADITVPG